MSSPETSSTPASIGSAEEPSVWLWAAMLVSLAALAGTLYLTIGMGLKACPLCLYQRTFVMGVVGVLAVGFFVRELPPRTLSLLALPLATAALVTAGYHEYLEQTGALECPRGILGYGTSPQQALGAQALLVVLLLADLVGRRSLIGLLAALILGCLLAFSAIQSARPAEPNYRLPVDEDMCRKPQAAS
jgi:disulfide bond formation protein DsbB